VFFCIYFKYVSFRVEKKLYDDLIKENMDLIEFNLVDREPVVASDETATVVSENNTNSSSAV